MAGSHHLYCNMDIGFIRSWKWNGIRKPYSRLACDSNHRGTV